MRDAWPSWATASRRRPTPARSLKVRPINAVTVWGRSAERAQAFSVRMSAELGIAFHSAPSAREAVRDADIVCTVTAAREPVLHGEWVRPGTHLNVVGSGFAGPAEVDNDLVVRSRFIADSRAGVLEQGAEFLRAKQAGAIDDSHIVGEIGQVLAGQLAGRRDRERDHPLQVPRPRGAGPGLCLGALPRRNTGGYNAGCCAGWDGKMTIQVTRVARALGAVVGGVDLTQELPQAQIERLGELLIEHQILFFRNQPVTPQQQARFAARFGTLHVHPIYPVLPDLPEIMLIDTHPGFLPDNDNWHTDVTFSQTPPMAGILAAKQLPSAGGDTLWSSSSAVYDTLSAPMQRFLEGLTAQHSVAKSFPAERWANDPDSKARYERAVAKHPPVNHPVVRTHPVSGRKGLFVNEGFTTHINELSPQESQALLAFLFAQAGRPELTVRWNWRVDDLAFWDNRVTQHYAIADYLPERRTMHRATVNGDKPY